jgi:dihydrofolate reductase
MRNIILNVTVSLDGLIEGPNGEYDWCFADQDYGMQEFLAKTDVIFIGRKSYELIANDPHPYFAKKKYIFSDSLAEVSSGDEIVRSSDFAATIEKVKQLPGKDIWLFGGASLLAACIEHGYIDEFLLSVHPIVLGAGKPLFENLKDRMKLTLVDNKTYDSGLVQLTYRVN